MEQSPLCYAALEYIHSLSGAREEKRGKRCEKEGGGEIERQDFRPGATLLGGIVRDAHLSTCAR